MSTYWIKQIYASIPDFWERRQCQPVDYGVEEAISYHKALYQASARLNIPRILLSATHIKKEEEKAR